MDFIRQHLPIFSITRAVCATSVVVRGCISSPSPPQVAEQPILDLTDKTLPNITQTLKLSAGHPTVIYLSTDCSSCSVVNLQKVKAAANKFNAGTIWIVPQRLVAKAKLSSDSQFFSQISAIEPLIRAGTLPVQIRNVWPQLLLVSPDGGVKTHLIGARAVMGFAGVKL